MLAVICTDKIMVIWGHGMGKRDMDSMLIYMFDRMLVKTTDYLDHFARFKQKENVEAVERLLSARTELAKFERAQLGMRLWTARRLRQCD